MTQDSGFLINNLNGFQDYRILKNGLSRYLILKELKKLGTVFKGEWIRG